MFRIKVSSLKPGVALGKDIYSEDGQLLLSKGEKVTSELLDVLIRRGVAEVIVKEDSQRSFSERRFEDTYSSSLAATKGFMLETKLGKSLDAEDVTKTVDMLSNQVYDQNDIFRQMRLMKDKDDYLFTHSLNVSILSIIIGRWLGLSSSSIEDLGKCGLLHDIGKVMIPDHILNKPGKLDDEEYNKIKEHSLIGYNLIKSYPWINSSVSQGVLYHHERLDGKGYPYGLTEGRIGMFAEIIAIADTYDALTSNRVYSPKVSPYTAVEVLWKESFGRLNPRYAKVFYDRVANFYVGNEVLLSNNEKGVVIFIDPSEPTRPIVRIRDRFCSLIEDRSIYVVEIFD